MKLIEVAAAIIVKDGKIFCAQRGPGRSMANKWEFPGGKLEKNETGEEAITREIMEELACRISVEKFFMTVEHDYPDFHLTMHCYICSLVNEMPILSEHLDCCWKSGEDLLMLDWADADAPLIDKLRYLYP